MLSDISYIFNKVLHNVKSKNNEINEKNEDKKDCKELESVNDNKEKITMGISSFTDSMENIINSSLKINIGISGVDNDEVDTDIELIKRNDCEDLTKEEIEYKETLMIAAGKQKEILTEIEQISQRLDSYDKFLNHLIKAKYPNMNDEQIEMSISSAKESILVDLQSGELPVKKYDEGYNMRDILKMFLGLATGKAFAQTAANIINEYGNNQ